MSVYSFNLLTVRISTSHPRRSRSKKLNANIKDFLSMTISATLLASSERIVENTAFTSICHLSNKIIFGPDSPIANYPGIAILPSCESNNFLWEDGTEWTRRWHGRDCYGYNPPLHNMNNSHEINLTYQQTSVTKLIISHNTTNIDHLGILQDAWDNTVPL
jgi:hypothetical protein